MKAEIRRMLDTIDEEAMYTASYTGRKQFSKQVMNTMAEVDRRDFVPEDEQTFAYDNGPLPIGCGQTISQPYIVALMTDMLDLTDESIVLEVGTGSGYQAAILSRLAKKVYTVEKIPELSDAASRRLQSLGYKNVETHCSDGSAGWEEKGPFDAVIVTAAAPYIPQALIDQLKPGGRMMIPVGMPYSHQELMLIEKNQDGTTETTSILAVAFVPLVMEKPPVTH